MSNVTVSSPNAENGTLASTSNSHVSAIVGGTIGGVVGLFAIGFLAFLWRRQGLNSADPSGSSTNRRLEDTVTPFNPMGSMLTTGTTPSVDGISQMTEQQQPLMSGTYSSHGAGRAGAVPGPPSSAPPLRVMPLLMPVTIPTGLSDKELAQMRSATSQPSSATPPMLSPQSDTSPNTSTPGRANTNTDRSSTTTRSRVEDQRPWQSEVDSLRREMEQLRAERFDAGAPPSYFSEVRPGVD